MKDSWNTYSNDPKTTPAELLMSFGAERCMEPQVKLMAHISAAESAREPQAASIQCEKQGFFPAASKTDSRGPGASEIRYLKG
jgi:hypothetical protein